MGRAEGKTDEEIVRSLGSPQQIAKDLQSTQQYEKVPVNHSEQNQFPRIGIIIGLFSSILLLSLLFYRYCRDDFGHMGYCFFFVAQLFIAGVQWIIHPESFYLFELFSSITLAGSGLLIFIVINYVTNAAIRIFSRYIAFNVRLVKGEDRA